MSAPRPDRIASLQTVMAERGIGLAVFGPGADMLYVAGRRLPLTERFNAVLLPGEGAPQVLVPRLQAPLVQPLKPAFDVAVWDEAEDPIRLAAAYAEALGAGTIAVDGHLWSGFLLRMQALLPKCRFVDATLLTTSLRLRKDEAELAVLAESGRRFDRVWEAFFSDGRLIGVTERDVVHQIEALVRAEGFDALAWCDVGSGPNGASPLHHHSERLIAPGDPVVIDFAATRDGYSMDTCRTPVAGNPDPDFRRIYAIVNAAHEAAARAIRPGVPAEAIDRAARDVIAAAGHGAQFTHRLGHGMGIDAHEEPYIVSGNALPLEPAWCSPTSPASMSKGAGECGSRTSCSSRTRAGARSTPRRATSS